MESKSPQSSAEIQRAPPPSFSDLNILDLFGSLIATFNPECHFSAYQLDKVDSYLKNRIDQQQWNFVNEKLLLVKKRSVHILVLVLVQEVLALSKSKIPLPVHHEAVKTTKEVDFWGRIIFLLVAITRKIEETALSRPKPQPLTDGDVQCMCTSDNLFCLCLYDKRDYLKDFFSNDNNVTKGVSSTSKVEKRKNSFNNKEDTKRHKPDKDLSKSVDRTLKKLLSHAKIRNNQLSAAIEKIKRAETIDKSLADKLVNKLNDLSCEIDLEVDGFISHVLNEKLKCRLENHNLNVIEETMPEKKYKKETAKDKKQDVDIVEPAENSIDGKFATEKILLSVYNGANTVFKKFKKVSLDDRCIVDCRSLKEICSRLSGELLKLKISFKHLVNYMLEKKNNQYRESVKVRVAETIVDEDTKTSISDSDDIPSCEEVTTPLDSLSQETGAIISDIHKLQSISIVDSRDIFGTSVDAVAETKYDVTNAVAIPRSVSNLSVAEHDLHSTKDSFINASQMLEDIKENKVNNVCADTELCTKISSSTKNTDELSKSSCSNCSRVFKCPKSLELHLISNEHCYSKVIKGVKYKQKTPNNPIPSIFCDVCDDSFELPSQLVQHFASSLYCRERNLKEARKKTPKAKKKKVFQCDVCGKRFKYTHSLESHVTYSQLCKSKAKVKLAENTEIDKVQQNAKSNLIIHKEIVTNTVNPIECREKITPSSLETGAIVKKTIVAHSNKKTDIMSKYKNILDTLTRRKDVFVVDGLSLDSNDGSVLCSICNVKLRCDYFDLNRHIYGKVHMENLKEDSKRLQSGQISLHKYMNVDVRNARVYCRLCHKDITLDQEAVDLHAKETSHLNRANPPMLRHNSDMVLSMNRIISISTKVLECIPCNVQLLNNQSMIQHHVQYESHHKRLNEYNTKTLREMMKLNPENYGPNTEFHLTEENITKDMIFVNPISRYAYCGVCKNDINIIDNFIKLHVNDFIHKQMLELINDCLSRSTDVPELKTNELDLSESSKGSMITCVNNSSFTNDISKGINSISKGDSCTISNSKESIKRDDSTTSSHFKMESDNSNSLKGKSIVTTDTSEGKNTAVDKNSKAHCSTVTNFGNFKGEIIGNNPTEKTMLRINQMECSKVDNLLLSCKPCKIVMVNNKKAFEDHIELPRHVEKLLEFNISAQLRHLESFPEIFGPGSEYEMSNSLVCNGMIFIDPVDKFIHCGLCRTHIANYAMINGHVLNDDKVRNQKIEESIKRLSNTINTNKNTSNLGSSKIVEKSGGKMVAPKTLSSKFNINIKISNDIPAPKPSTSSNNNNVPASKASTSNVSANVPASKPSTSSNNNNVPASKPSTSSNNNNVPASKPSTSSNNNNVPASKASTSNVSANVPASKPSTSNINNVSASKAGTSNTNNNVPTSKPSTSNINNVSASKAGTSNTNNNVPTSKPNTSSINNIVPASKAGSLNIGKNVPASNASTSNISKNVLTSKPITSSINNYVPSSKPGVSNISKNVPASKASTSNKHQNVTSDDSKKLPLSVTNTSTANQISSLTSTKNPSNSEDTPSPFVCKCSVDAKNTLYYIPCTTKLGLNNYACMLCNIVGITSDKNLRDHLHGRTHKSNYESFSNPQSTNDDELKYLVDNKVSYLYGSILKCFACESTSLLDIETALEHSKTAKHHEKLLKFKNTNEVCLINKPGQLISKTERSEDVNVQKTTATSQSKQNASKVQKEIMKINQQNLSTNLLTQNLNIPNSSKIPLGVQNHSLTNIPAVGKDKLLVQSNVVKVSVVGKENLQIQSKVADTSKTHKREQQSTVGCTKKDAGSSHQPQTNQKPIDQMYPAPVDGKDIVPMTTIETLIKSSAIIKDCYGYFCTVCNVNTKDIPKSVAHLGSKNHKKMLIDGVRVLKEGRFHCDACRVPIQGIKNVMEHMSSTDHYRNMRF